MSVLTSLLSIFSCTKSKSDFKPGVAAARGYYVENAKVYFYGGFENASVTELKDANASTFKVLHSKTADQKSGSEYASDGEHVYLAGKLIRQADGKTFEVLGFALGRDARHVFSLYSILSDDPNYFREVEGGLFKDRKHVYRGDQIISDHPETLKFIGTSGHYAFHSDAQGVLANGTRIDSADANSFEPLSYGYAKDRNRIYLIEDASTISTINAEPATFQVIAQYYTKDQSKVFWRGRELPGADPSEFKVISAEHHCSCDHRSVYFRDKRIPGVNAAGIPAGKRVKFCNESGIVFED